jgi:hypothetical protein
VALLSLAAPGCRRAASEPHPEARSSSAAPSPPPPQAAPAKSSSTGYSLTPAETAAVDDFLRRHTTLRPATDGDRRPGSEGDSDLKNIYGVYHPYFVRGDVNDDGVLDFVMAFVRRDSDRSPRWFSIAVFSGTPAPGGRAFSEGTFLERDVSLGRGDLSIDRDSIIITPDLDEDAVRRYRWDAARRTFVFVRDSEDESDPPTVSQTSRPARPRPGAVVSF